MDKQHINEEMLRLIKENRQANMIMDYKTLLLNYELLDMLQNCNIILPISNFEIFKSIVKKNKEKSNCYRNQYEELKKFNNYRFFMFQVNNSGVLEKMVLENRFFSDPVCLCEERNLHLYLSALFSQCENILSDEIRENIESYEYDILCSCLKFQMDLLTTNDSLINIIQRYDLNISYIIPVISENY